jgi:hypothetical protein
VDSDPEYEFSDNFRASQKSNLSRQLLLHRLSNRLEASISGKVTSLGGNAVLAYQQHFDMEGDSGIVGRAYGTAFRYPIPRALSPFLHQCQRVHSITEPRCCMLVFYSRVVCTAGSPSVLQCDWF